MNKQILNGWIQITNRCNLNCKYCYMNANKDRTDMDLDKFYHVVNEFKTLNIQNVMLSGGEPCLNLNFLQMIEYLYLQGFHVGLVTNGTILTDDLLSSLKKNKVNVQVSIDSINYDTYLQSRGVDKINQVIDNIRQISQSTIDLSLSSTLNNITINDLESVVSFALENQIYTLHYGFLVPSDRCKNYNLTMSNVLVALNRLYEIQLEKYLHLQIDFVENYVRNIISEDKNPYFCNSMACKNIEILPNGDIYQCGAFLSMKENKKNKINIFELQNQELTKILDRNWKPIGICDLPECSICNERFICKGGCRAISYQTSGDLYKKQPMCNEFKTFIQAIISDYKKGRLAHYIQYLKLIDKSQVYDDNSYVKYF